MAKVMRQAYRAKLSGSHPPERKNRKLVPLLVDLFALRWAASSSVPSSR
jgi:hypothetical protein